MMKAAAEIEKEQWEVVKVEDKKALNTMAKNGMKISEASDALKKELSKVVTVGYTNVICSFFFPIFKVFFYNLKKDSISHLNAEKK